MTEHTPHDAASTPWDAPLIPPFPIEMRNVTILTAFYRTDPEAIAAVLPSPLKAVKDIVAVHFYDMTDTDYFGAYRESAIQVEVELPGTGERGSYSPYLFLNSDGAVAAGRETYGQPKKLAKPTLEVRQDLVVGEIRRNRVKFLRVTTPYKQKRAEISDAFDIMNFVTNINYKVIPDVAGGAAIRELTARELSDVVVHECWRAPATVELRPHAQAPVHRLPVREMLDGFYWRCDFTLRAGRVIHDYRA